MPKSTLQHPTHSNSNLNTNTIPPALSSLLSSHSSSHSKSPNGPPPPYAGREHSSEKYNSNNDSYTHPPMSSTHEPKAVGGQMSEGVGVSRIKPKPKESKLAKLKKYVQEDAAKQAQGDIWGGVKGMGGHG